MLRYHSEDLEDSRVVDTLGVPGYIHKSLGSNVAKVEQIVPPSQLYQLLEQTSHWYSKWGEATLIFVAVG